LRQKCQVFFSDAWNVIDTFSTVIFFIGFFIRLHPDLVAHGRVYYCISVMFFIVRIIEYFDVSRRLGPFNFMIGKMVSDVKFVTNTGRQNVGVHGFDFVVVKSKRNKSTIMI